MKNIFKSFVAILLMLLLFLSSCESKVPSSLKEKYPNSLIEKELWGYSVVSKFDNFDWLEITDVNTSAGSIDRRVYESFDEIYSEYSAVSTKVFLGKKTGESKQYIPIDKTDYVNGIYFTESVVEVIEPYFGDITTGQKLIYRELFAVFADENGNKKINGVEKPVGDEERIFVVGASGNAELYENEAQHLSIDGPYYTDISKYENLNRELYRSEVIAKAFIEKYYINKDTAVDKVQLAKYIAHRKKESIKKKIDTLSKEELSKYEMLTDTLKEENATYSQLKEFLTDKEVESIENIAKRYGEIKK